MKKRKYYMILFSLLMTAVLLSACTSGGDQEKEHKGREINLYYLNVDENDFIQVPYRLSQVNNPEKESLEVIGLLSSKDEADKSDCKVTIPEEVAVNTIKVEGGEETIDFGAGYQQMDPIQESMMRLAVVRSVCQVRGVESVTFTVNGEAIQNINGKAMEKMTADQVLLSEEYDRIFEQEGKVTLYYSDTKGSVLIPYETTVKARDNEPLAEAALKRLMHPPKEEESMICPLPEGVKINQTMIVGNICYVDLSSEINNLVPEVEEEVTVYSMVNTIVSLNEKYMVQFTVDGERADSLNGFKDFNRPLAYNKDLVRQTGESNN